MQYIITPHHNSARYAIKYYKLKKDMAPCPFPVFLSGDIVLCVSGDSCAYAAAASSYILTRWGIGGLFCFITEGSFLYPHTITDGGQTVIYQEMLYKPPFKPMVELMVKPPFKHSFEPHDKCGGTLKSGCAVHAYLAAGRFLPISNILVLRGTDDEGVLKWLLETSYMVSSPTFMQKTE